MLTDAQKDVLKIMAGYEMRTERASMPFHELYQDTDQSRSFLFSICYAIWKGDVYSETKEIQFHAKLSLNFLISLASKAPIVLRNLKILFANRYASPYPYSPNTDRIIVGIICHGIVKKVLTENEAIEVRLSEFGEISYDPEDGRLLGAPYILTRHLNKIAEKLDSCAYKSLAKYIDRMLFLKPCDRERLIKNINNSLPSLDQRQENYFVRGLLLLLENRVKLEQIAPLENQEDYVDRANITVMLLNDGVSFDKITQLNAKDLDTLIKTYGDSVGLSITEILDTGKPVQASEKAMQNVHKKLEAIFKSTQYKM